MSRFRTLEVEGCLTVGQTQYKVCGGIVLLVPKEGWAGFFIRPESFRDGHDEPSQVDLVDHTGRRIQGSVVVTAVQGPGGVVEWVGTGPPVVTPHTDPEKT